MSSSSLALRAQGLGKLYRIGAASDGRYSTLREAMVSVARAPLGLFRRRGRPSPATELWAVRDLDLEIRAGEAVGVIGRNGAGKSTLLKILSGITRPTLGRVEAWGRVATLLEVGTGFHPELTGRENVYLNGAVLGMRRQEVRRKFDQIVDFAEIERFLDTPVKHYSTGMYMRLAFAVAAHLEPEILVVDEVLAVGDAKFQRKCLGKMAEVGCEGRTVLFVSHNMPAVTRLCRRVILLDHGRLIADGDAPRVVRAYLDGDHGSLAERTWENPELAPGDKVVRLFAVRVRDQDGQVSDVFDIRRPIAVEVEYQHLGSTLRPAANLHFFNEEGVCLFISNEFTSPDWHRLAGGSGRIRSTCWIPGNFLAEGRVTILAAVSSYNPTVIHVLERDAVSFQVVDHSDGDGVRGQDFNHWPGVVRPMLSWTTELEAERAAIPAASVT